MRLLIADGGATKTEWILLENRLVKYRFMTNGFNPNYAPVSAFENVLRSDFPASFPVEVDEIRYYGSGCAAEDNCVLVKTAIQKRFPRADVAITHDLMAAAHATLGRNLGIACILGTGSNSCLYDGNRIIGQGISLGYLVGDEGSGCHIGKEVVRSFFYEMMPEELCRQFDAEYGLDRGSFVNRLYHDAQPSKYLASFSRFAGNHQDHPFIKDLCTRCFNAFIDSFICRYDGYSSLNVSFVGSVAYHFQAILRDALNERGISVGQVLQSPAEGLIRFYTSE